MTRNQSAAGEPNQKVDRFSNYGEFKAYMGWYPRVAQSGTSVNSSGLAKKAVRLSRNVLGQMTAVLLAPTVRTTPFREYYDRLVARGMKPGTAQGHMAGKLAVALVVQSRKQIAKSHASGYHATPCAFPANVRRPHAP